MPATPAKKARNDYILKLRTDGLSYNQITWKLEEEGFERITVQAVQQIVKRHEKGQAK